MARRGPTIWPNKAPRRCALCVQAIDGSCSTTLVGNARGCEGGNVETNGPVNGGGVDSTSGPQDIRARARALSPGAGELLLERTPDEAQTAGRAGSPTDCPTSSPDPRHCGLSSVVGGWVGLGYIVAKPPRAACSIDTCAQVSCDRQIQRARHPNPGGLTAVWAAQLPTTPPEGTQHDEGHGGSHPPPNITTPGWRSCHSAAVHDHEPVGSQD